MKNINQKALVRAITPLVPVLLAARATAEVERERADRIQRAILDSSVFMRDSRWGEPERITDPKRAYLMNDEDAARYFAALDVAYREAGYVDLEPGQCPALVAESARIKLENELLDAAEPSTGIAANRILCAGLEKRAEYLRLLIGLALKAPRSLRRA
jgi:hypothetical protein